MKRKEAEKSIGKLVKISYKGIVGKLVKVLDTKPFRALISVEFILKYPEQYKHHKQLQFYWLAKNKDGIFPPKKGDLLEFGASSIELFNGEILDYNESVELALDNYINTVKENLNNENYYIGSIDDGEKLLDILFKHKRLRGGGLNNEKK